MALNKDFRVQVGFCDHPKTIKLYARFGGDGIFALIRLWEYTAKWRTDGRLTNDDRETLLIACGLRSVEGFIEQLVLMRWLDVEDRDGARRDFRTLEDVTKALDGLQEEGLVLVVHDWDEHNPYAAKAKERSKRGRDNAAKRYASSSGDSSASGKGNGNAGGNANGRGSGSAAGAAGRRAGGSAPLPLPAPAPSPSGASSAPGQAPEDEQGDTAVFISIPTNKRDEYFDVTERLVRFWTELFPAVDVRQELRNIRAWNDANKKKRKTMEGVENHIVLWLTDRQNKPKGGPAQVEAEEPRGFDDADLEPR